VQSRSTFPVDARVYAVRKTDGEANVASHGYKVFEKISTLVATIEMGRLGG
jgi:hypothetical protein